MFVKNVLFLSGTESGTGKQSFCSHCPCRNVLPLSSDQAPSHLLQRLSPNGTKDLLPFQRENKLLPRSCILLLLWSKKQHSLSPPTPKANWRLSKQRCPTCSIPNSPALKCLATTWTTLDESSSKGKPVAPSSLDRPGGK